MSKLFSWFSLRPSKKRDSKTFHYDIATKSGLEELQNSKVILAEHYERPLAGKTSPSIIAASKLKHAGVVVTLENGQRFLVHKGGQFGVDSQTVVVDAQHMTNKWTKTQSKPVYFSKVSDYVAAGGVQYRLLTDNCQDAAQRMMELP